MAETELNLPGEPPVTVHLRRAPRARRLSLRVSRLDGKVTLTAPPRAAMGELRAFLAERADWVRGHLATQPPPVLVGPGMRLPVEGQRVSLVAGTGRSARREGDQLWVAPARAGAQAQRYLKGLAQTRLTEQTEALAARLGRQPTALALRDPRSRWGSCSSQGRLMFSWRLIMAPPRILSYVAAHEVAHLVEMNHSPAFWARVAELHPGWEADRRWLREHGAWMHRYRFEPEGQEAAA